MAKRYAYAPGLATFAILASMIFAASSNFVPDYVFKGSALTGWHKLGAAEWRAENGEIVLRVEDDGIGPGAAPAGVGLTNVAERLTSLYQDRASLTLAPRPGGGARATIRIPRNPCEA